MAKVGTLGQNKAVRVLWVRAAFWFTIVLGITPLMTAHAVDRPANLPVEVWEVIRGAISDEWEIPYYVSTILNVGRFPPAILLRGWQYLGSVPPEYGWTFRMQVASRFLGATVADTRTVSEGLGFFSDVQMPYPPATNRSLERIERFDLPWRDRQLGWHYLSLHGAASASSSDVTRLQFERVFNAALHELQRPSHAEAGPVVFRTLLNSPPDLVFPEALEQRLQALRGAEGSESTLRVLVLMRTRMHRIPDVRRILTEDFRSPNLEVRSLALETAIAILREDRVHPGILPIEDVAALRRRLHLALSQNTLDLPDPVLSIMLDIMGDEELGAYYLRIWQHANTATFFRVFGSYPEIPGSLLRHLRGLSEPEKREFVRQTLRFPSLVKLLEPSSHSWLEFVDALGDQDLAARLPAAEARMIIAGVGELVLPNEESVRGLENVRALSFLLYLNGRRVAEVLELPGFTPVEGAALLAYPGIGTRAATRAWARVLTRASHEELSQFFVKASGLSSHAWWRMAVEQARARGWLTTPSLVRAPQPAGEIEPLSAALPLAERLFVADPSEQARALDSIPSSEPWQHRDPELRAAVRAYRMQPGLAPAFAERAAILNLEIARSVARDWTPREWVEGVLGLMRSEVPEDWLVAAESLVQPRSRHPLAPWLASELLRLRGRNFELLQAGNQHRNAATGLYHRIQLLEQNRGPENPEISVARAHSVPQAREDIRWLIRAQIFTESAYWIMVHAMGNFSDDLELQQLARRYQDAFLTKNPSACSRYWIFRGLRSGS